MLLRRKRFQELKATEVLGVKAMAHEVLVEVIEEQDAMLREVLRALDGADLPQQLDALKERVRSALLLDEPGRPN